jgi:peptide/nickel transport system substrate-binding protein
MFRSKSVLLIVSVLAVFSMILSACAPAATPPTAPTAAPTTPPKAVPTAEVKPTVVSPTAEPAMLKSKDPTVFNDLTLPGDPETLDPSVDYETAGSSVLFNIYENLIDYAGPDPLKFEPALAKSIPTPTTDDKGNLLYTWEIIDGVKFHNGDPLTAEDVAFSFWRSMLVGDYAVAPNFLVLQSLFLNSETGDPLNDPTELVDPKGALISDPEGLKKAPAAKLEAACQKVKDAVIFDEAARTVTMKSDHVWGPFMATMAGGQWAAVMDKKWVAAQGDWDGDCKTWQNFYSIPSESGMLRDKTNGTGPYALDHWTPGQEIVLVANPDYRKGEAKIKRVVINFGIAEFGTRFAAFQAGDADFVREGSQADWTQLDTLVRDVCDATTNECQPVDPPNPNGILKVYKNLPSVNRTDIYFNFNVAEGSTYMGSSLLDGSGVPRDFFSDVHIRRAFNYCFDWDTYIKDVQLGEGVQAKAVTLPGQPGYDDSPYYSFDLKKCEEEFKASTWKTEDGTSLWDVGFYLQIAYNAGNTQRQTIAEILAANLQQVNPNFFISPVPMPWPTLLRTIRAKQAPMAIVGWQEDIHDPHNWYVPYFSGTYATRFSLPAEMQKKYAELYNKGVAETDFNKRAAIYLELNKLVYEDAPLILLSSSLTRNYQPLYLQGWFGSKTQNPMVLGQGPFFYSYSKD